MSNVGSTTQPTPNVATPATLVAQMIAAGELSEIQQAVFYPASTNTQDIINMANAVSTLGGGVIQLPAGSITLTASLPLLSNVVYRGILPGGTVIASTSPVSGTMLVGNGTFPAFAFNAIDGATPPSVFATFVGGMLQGCGVQGFILNNFSYGIKCGALYQPGCQFSEFRDIVAVGCGYGYWFENFIECNFENLTELQCINGAIMFVASGGTALAGGNSTFRKIFAQEQSAAGLARGICFWVRGTGPCSFNDLDVRHIQCNRQGSVVISQACTMVNTQANITITDGTKFAVDMPVSFDGTQNGFNQNQIYFIKSVAGNVVLVANNPGGTAIAATGNAAVNMITYGFAQLEVVAYGSNSFQPCRFSSIDLEGFGTTKAVLYQANYCEFYTNFVMGGEGTTCVNDLTWRSSINTRIHAANPILIDGDGSSQCMELHGGTQRFNELNPTSSQIGIGIQTTRQSGLNGPKQFTGMLSLAGISQPDMWINTATGALQINNFLQQTQQQVPSTQNIGTAGMFSFVVYTGAGGDTLTLPAVSANYQGLMLYIHNPGAGTLTVQTSSSQNIVGLGASGTSISLATKTGALLIAASAAAFYWARFA